MYVTYNGVNLSTLGGLTGVSSVRSYAVTRTPNAFGMPDTYTVTMGVEGTICLVPGTTYTTAQAQEAINGAVSALENLLAVQGVDCVFHQDGGTATAHAILSGPSIGGTRVQGPEYSDTGPAEFATGRKWSFSVSAVFDDPQFTDLISYQETVQISGGGPRVIPVEVTDGPVRFYTTASVTTGILVQSGQVVGRSQHIALPASLDFPNYVASLSSATVARPNYQNGVARDYVRTWRYFHQKSGPYDLPELVGVTF